jgi:hypothetical protein
MAVRLMETAETAMETDGDGSGGTSHPDRVPEQRLLSLKICFDDGGAAELFWKKCRLFLGFPSGGSL